MERLARDASLRESLGRNARERAKEFLTSRSLGELLERLRPWRKGYISSIPSRRCI